MLDIYLESDIAISAGGSSCYELAYFGIPNIIITVSDNQLNIAKELNKKNVSIYLGKKEDFSPNRIKENVLKLINDTSLRKKMAENGRKLVDGKGKKRIADVIEKYKWLNKEGKDIKTIKIGNKKIGKNHSCFIIAEAGANFRISDDKKKKF